MLLMIDNYDSFTFNLVQYFGELGEEVRVFRNDEIDVVEELLRRLQHAHRNAGIGEAAHDARAHRAAANDADRINV